MSALSRTPPLPEPAVVAALLAVAKAFPNGRVKLSPSLLEPVLGQAARHGLVPVLGEVLRRSEDSLAQTTSVSRALMAAAAKTLRVKRLLRRVLPELQAHGLVPVLLKGYGLGARLYGSPFLRPTTDVDLLLRPQELPAADVCLRGMGLRTLSWETTTYRLAHHHHVNYSAPEGLVELHFRALTCFGTELPAEPLWERAELTTLEGWAVRYLSPEDELLYLAAHAANHLLQRLGWLLDLKLMAEQARNLDWAALVSRAQASAMSAPVYFALDAARRVLDAQIPESALEPLRPPRWQRPLGPALFSPRALVWAPFEQHKYVAHLATALLSTTPRHMARYGWHHTQHAAKRRLAQAWPTLAPNDWRG